MPEPAAPPLGRAALSALGIDPDTRLGQHFLVDRNLVGVALRLAELEPDDVAVEIGPGAGVLTSELAQQVAQVHAIEVDRRLEPVLERVLARHPNVHLVWGDAMAVDLAALVPPPTAMVANLPYNVGTPLVVESLGRAPSLERWSVMLQREVAERFFAREGTSAYGSVSVLLRLATERTGFHAVPRSVFVPPPNVDSALIAFRRRGEWPTLAPQWSRIRAVVHAAFGHRRKTLVNSVVLAGLAPRAEVEAALAAIGADSGVRAEALAPEAFVALAAVLRVTSDAAIVQAPAKINLYLRVGERRPDGYHDIQTLMARLDLSDRLVISPAERTVIRCPALPGGDTLVARALELLCAEAKHERGFRVRIDKHVPTGAGLGGGSSDAAAALRAANAFLPTPLDVATLHGIAAGIGSDVPFFLGPPVALALGRGELVTPAPALPECYIALAQPERPLATRDVYEAHVPTGPLGSLPPAPHTIEELAAIVVNDLEPAADRLEPACARLRNALLERGALAAALTGSGSAVFGVFRTEVAAATALEGLADAAWTARATLRAA